ncbi:MAG TPA: 2-oxoacid:ferredoxin oxidoreductase subunit beta, partial [Actinomycetota bacterium]
FNDGAFESLTDKATKADHTLLIEHGRPLVFGADGTRGVRVRDDLCPEVVDFDGDPAAAGIFVFDETNPLHSLVVGRLAPPDFPTPIGVVAAVDRPCYEDGTTALVRAAEASEPADLPGLLHRGDVWTVS